MVTLAQIYDWFMTGKKPTQAQFWASWGSFWNKLEQIPQSSISGLLGVLNAKAEKAQFDAHKTDENAHAALFDAKEDKTQKGVAGGYVPLNEFVKIANEYLTIVNDLVTGGATSIASAETVKTLKTQIDNINILLASDNVNLDNVQELVDAIETVQTSLSTILVNDLTTGGTTKALTAEMGKTLKGLIDGLVVPTATDTVRGIVKVDTPVADPVVYTTETTDNLLKAKVNAILEIKPITGIAYTLIAYDTENLVQLAYDGTLPMTVTIPNDATLNLPVGSIFYTVGSNTGALTIAGGSGVTFQTAVGLTAGQNETRKYVKKAANTWQVEGGAQPMAVGGAKTYKTYFVNSATGVNATGAYEDASKPYATIDYVAALPAFKENDIIYLMGAQNYNCTGTFPDKSIIIKSNEPATLNFSSHGNTNLFANAVTAYVDFTIDLPNGTIHNDRSGGTGVLATITSGSLNIYIKAKSVYWNTSSAWLPYGTFKLEIQTLSCYGMLIGSMGITYRPTVSIGEFVCLVAGARPTTEASVLNINKISGSGSFSASGNLVTNIGDCTATGGILIQGAGLFNFENSVISSVGVVVGNGGNGLGDVTITGKIKSMPSFNVAGVETGVIRFKDFTADFGSGYIQGETFGTTYIVEGCNIKCNSYLFNLSSGGRSGNVRLINSSIEQVTPTTLIAGGNSPSVFGLRISNIASNATSISTGTGITTTTFTSY